jgi:DNA-binding NtrC family response regulator
MDTKIGKNVIVVDDDRSIRVVISTALTRAGYNVNQVEQLLECGG